MDIFKWTECFHLDGLSLPLIHQVQNENYYISPTQFNSSISLFLSSFLTFSFSFLLAFIEWYFPVHSCIMLYLQWIYYTHPGLGLPSTSPIQLTTLYIIMEIWHFIKTFSTNFLSKEKIWTQNKKVKLFKDNFLMSMASLITNCNEQFWKSQSPYRHCYIHIDRHLQTFLNFQQNWVKLIFLNFGKCFDTHIMVSTCLTYNSQRLLNKGSIMLQFGFVKHARTWGPLLWLFPLPGTLSPRAACFVSHYHNCLLTCPLINEAFCGHPIWNSNFPLPPRPPPSPLLCFILFFSPFHHLI